MDPETSMAAPAPTTPLSAEAETVLIRVPADPDYLGIIRAAAAHVGTMLGCTLSEVSDLRLAVDEASGLLLRHTVRAPRADGGGDLHCQFALDGTALSVVLSLRAYDAQWPDDDEFGWTILTALVDDIAWRVDGPSVRVEILKRRPVGR